MPERFLTRYVDTFDRIPGWFLPDAYLVIAAYNQLLADDGRPEARPRRAAVEVA